MHSALTNQMRCCSHVISDGRKNYMTSASRHLERTGQSASVCEDSKRFLVMNNWNSDMEDDLIDYYEANRILYDTGSSEFKNTDKKKQVKDNIAKRLKISGMYNCLHYRSIVTRHWHVGL